jgi:glucokinase
VNTYLGIEIGGTKLQLVLGDENARITQRFRFVVDRAAGAEKIREHIADTLQRLKSEKLSAIGVGYGGPINRFTGEVWGSHQVKGWSGFPLKTWLEDLSGVPAGVDNDANVAALGEALHGAGKDYNNVFYITIGSGVGSGLVLNKEIYHGALPGEAEMGHIRLDKTGRTVESSCSGWAVDKKVRDIISSYPNSRLAKLAATHPGAEAKALAEAIHLNDAQATKILDETCDDLAFGISHAVHLLHPETIILGGGLSLLGEPLRNSVEQKLKQYVMHAFRPGPIIQLSALKEDAVPIGALQLADFLL